MIKTGMFRRRLVIAALASIALVAVACSSDEPEPTAVPPAATSAPAPTAAPVADGDAMMDDDVNHLMMAQTEASIIVPLEELNESGQQGVAILVGQGDTTELVVDISSGETDVPQPIHLHQGGCGSLGDVAFALSDIVNGESVTTVESSLAELLTGGFAINGHKSAEQIGEYVACGEVPNAIEAGTFTLEAIDGSGQHGSVSFIDRPGGGDDGSGASTAIVISVGSADVGLEQPVPIHQGSCDNLGDVAIPLTNVVDGRSITIWDAPISEVMQDGFVVNLHKSADEVAVYTACGELTSSAPIAMSGDAMMTDDVAMESDGDAMMSEDGAISSDISGFNLEDLTISVGDVIAWTNRDNAPHTVTHGVSPVVDPSAAFQSGSFFRDQSFSSTFTTAGTFAYFCEVHPSMTGTITVQ